MRGSLGKSVRSVPQRVFAVAAAVVLVASASCASQETLAQIDAEIASLSRTIGALEVQDATGDLTTDERTRLVWAQQERTRLSGARTLVDPGTGPQEAVGWLVRAASGDPRALGEGAAGVGSLLALLGWRRRRKRRASKGGPTLVDLSEASISEAPSGPAVGP